MRSHKHRDLSLHQPVRWRSSTALPMLRVGNGKMCGGIDVSRFEVKDF